MRKKFRLTKKRFRDGSGNEKEMYYPTSISNNMIDTKEVAREISHATSLSIPDALAATHAFSIVIAQHLALGNKIKLDGIGIFGLSVTGEGVENKEDFDLRTLEVKKVTFKADKELIQKVRETYTKG